MEAEELIAHPTEQFHSAHKNRLMERRFAERQADEAREEAEWREEMRKMT